MSSEKEMSPITTSASPEGWNISKLDASRPRRGLDHISHSEVPPVYVDSLQQRDVAPDSGWELNRHIPIILVDTLDSYWAFERVLNKLHAVGATKEEAKSDLVTKLAGHLNLLSSLESPGMAPILKLELEFLRTAIRPVKTTSA